MTQYLLILHFLSKSLAFYLFIFGWAGSSLLRGLFSSCTKPGLFFTAVYFSYCEAWALGHVGFGSCGVWVQQLRHMGLTAPQHVGFLGVGVKPGSPALAGRFLTTSVTWEALIKTNLKKHFAAVSHYQVKRLEVL